MGFNSGFKGLMSVRHWLAEISALLSPASFEQQVWCHRESGACPGLQKSHYLSSSPATTWYIHHAVCTL